VLSYRRISFSQSIDMIIYSIQENCEKGNTGIFSGEFKYTIKKACSK